MDQSLYYYSICALPHCSLMLMLLLIILCSIPSQCVPSIFRILLLALTGEAMSVSCFFVFILLVASQILKDVVLWTYLYSIFWHCEFCPQVPDRFIEVSEVALREFYSAIWTGRDSDPCWKKGIYKIICKLDSPVPDAFRLPGCPVGWWPNHCWLVHTYKCMHKHKRIEKKGNVTRASANHFKVWELVWRT